MIWILFCPGVLCYQSGVFLTGDGLKNRSRKMIEHFLLASTSLWKFWIILCVPHVLSTVGEFLLKWNQRTAHLLTRRGGEWKPPFHGAPSFSEAPFMAPSGQHLSHPHPLNRMTRVKTIHFSQLRLAGGNQQHNICLPDAALLKDSTRR